MRIIIDFDQSVSLWLNQFSRISSLFNHGVFLLTANELLKGGVFMGAFWFWWWYGQDTAKNRRIIVSTFITSLLAMFSAKLIGKLLPFRDRPLYAEELNFLLPQGVEGLVYAANSFPSDHAALFFSLAIGLFLLSVKWRIIGIAYASIFIMLPRIYLGFHYPSDIFGGALIAMVLSLMVHKTGRLQKGIIKKTLEIEKVKPSIFYAVFFLFTLEMSNLFNYTRSIAHFFKLIVSG